MQIVGVEMQDVEFMCSAPYPVKHREMMDQWILTAHVETQGGATARFQCGRGLRVAAGKKRHLVPKPDQFLGQIRHDPFGSAIEPRRTTLIKRSDLRDFHGISIPNLPR